jgi:hypothetical protein
MCGSHAFLSVSPSALHTLHFVPRLLSPGLCMSCAPT